MLLDHMNYEVYNVVKYNYLVFLLCILDLENREQRTFQFSWPIRY